MSQWVTMSPKQGAQTELQYSIQVRAGYLQWPRVFIVENLMTRHAHQDILDAVDLERLAAEFISRLNTRKIAFGQGGFKGHRTIWRHWRPLGDGLCLRRLSDSKKGHWATNSETIGRKTTAWENPGESPLGERRLSDNKKDHWTTMDEKV